MEAHGGSLSERMVGLRLRWSLWSSSSTYWYVCATPASEGGGCHSLLALLRWSDGRVGTRLKEDELLKEG